MKKFIKKITTLIVAVGLFYPFAFPVVASAANLSVSPVSATYSVGERATVKIVISGENSLNAVSASIYFPKSIFSIESVSKSGSVLDFWVSEPSFSNATGLVQFEGVSLHGFQGNGGLVITVVLKALREGSEGITFQSGKVLANDGEGTDITGNLIGATYVVKRADKKIEPKTEEREIIEEAAPALSPLPAITIFPGEAEGSSAVVGASLYPFSNVVLTFISENGSKVFITGITGEKGDFSIIIPKSLRDGKYSINAVIVLDDSRYSLPSNILNIDIGGVFYGEITWKTSTYASLLMAAILLFLVLYFIWRGYWRKTKATILLDKEVKEAKKVLHDSFKILEEDLKEGDKAEDVMGDLKDAEKIIEKEIEDIKFIDLDEK